MVTTDADTIFTPRTSVIAQVCVSWPQNQLFALDTKQVSAGKIEYPGGNLGFRVAPYSCVCVGNIAHTGRNPPTGAKDMALLCFS